MKSNIQHQERLGQAQVVGSAHVRLSIPEIISTTN